MEIALPYYIRSEVPGLEALALLSSRILNHDDSDVVIDVRRLAWLDANLMTAIGVILAHARSLGKRIRIIGELKEEIMALMKLNLFHSAEFGRKDSLEKTEKMLSAYRNKSYLPYCRFKLEEKRDFMNKYARAFVKQGFIPFVDAVVQDKVIECLMELFDNAKNHSESSHGVFVCGQFFPYKHLLRLTIADAGVGFSGCLRNKLSKSLSGKEAIEWAMMPDAHSARKTQYGLIPGGNGLQVLQEFVENNGGSISVLSEKGLWYKNSFGVVSKNLDAMFPGSVVTFEVDTSRAGRYRLKDVAAY